MVETKVEIVQVNAVTFWPCTYKRVTVEAVINEWRIPSCFPCTATGTIETKENQPRTCQ
jgi:hypothetical protein